MALIKKKHNNADFFIADIFDGTAFKNDMASMEHPFYSLSKKPHLKPFEYRNGTTEITVTPHGTLGMPTIFDKDLLLYCGSILMAELNEGRTPPRSFYISSHDFFIATNRNTGGDSYEQFYKALDRLAGCYIKTNVKTNGQRQVDGFGLLTYGFVESMKIKNRNTKVKITPCEWFYNSIMGREVLSINRDYFRLGKPLERRLYEIARKHCGSKQKKWHIGIEKLFEKSGSRDRLTKFKAALKKIIEEDDIPDYQYALDSNDKVTVTRTRVVEEHTTQDMVRNFKRRIKKQTLVNAENLHNASYTNWDMSEIIVQFVVFAESKKEHIDVDAAFIGFLKKKVKTNREEAAY